MKLPDKSWSALAVMKYWIAQRHAMYLLRKAGKPWPWSADPILNEYRFTNVTRRLDATTIVLHQALRGLTWEQKLLACVAFRVFNRTSTWAMIHRYVVPTWKRPWALLTLRQASRDGVALTSAVWMVGGEKGKQIFETQLEAVDYAQTNMALLRSAASSLEAMHVALRQAPRVGAFVGNEILMDLLYEAHLLVAAPDKQTYVYLGPGAVCGAQQLRGKEPRYDFDVFHPTNDPADLECFRTVAEVVMDRPLQDGYRLTIHDVEHSLCETNKYIRALKGSMPKRRYRGPTS